MSSPDNLPLVSVIMPAYNTQSYIAEAINSALNQTYRNIELVIYDDGSTDSTWEVINSFSDPRIRKYKEEKNQGYLKACNYLYAKSRGKYITNQDSDDWSDPTRIEKQLAIFNTYPDIFITGTNGYLYRNSQAKPISSYDPPSGLITDISKIFPFVPASAMFKKEVLNVVPGMNEYFNGLIAMDLYFYFQILYRYKGYYISERLYYARFTVNSNTRSLGNIRKFIADDIYYLLRDQTLKTGTNWLEQQSFTELKKFEDTLLSDKKLLSEKYRALATHYIDEGEFKVGASLLKKAFSYNPLNLNIYRSLLYILKKRFRHK